MQPVPTRLEQGQDSTTGHRDDVFSLKRSTLFSRLSHQCFIGVVHRSFQAQVHLTSALILTAREDTECQFAPFQKGTISTQRRCWLVSDSTAKKQRNRAQNSAHPTLGWMHFLLPCCKCIWGMNIRVTNLQFYRASCPTASQGKVQGSAVRCV